MGKRSIRENKNSYQQARERAELTRERAGELMEFVSADRIEKIESGKSLPHPDEVLAMAACYKQPQLCNYYCACECEIGRTHVPQLEEKPLSQIVLELLDSLNAMNGNRERLIAITVDGKLEKNEFEDYRRIRDQLSRLSSASESLRLWVEKSIAEGSVDSDIND